ncbi:uncharacterized protein [Engystomops pustulosus]|uniref:uncharacterized protein n=1 Tax=Engystomops pustulosus TaxID=76066 RepID=UPI003AFB080A
MASDDAIRRRIREEGSGWLASLLAEAQASGLPANAAPPASSGVRRSGRQSPPPQRLSPSAQAAVHNIPVTPPPSGSGTGAALAQPAIMAVVRAASPDCIPPTPMPASSSSVRHLQPLASATVGSSGGRRSASRSVELTGRVDVLTSVSEVSPPVQYPSSTLAPSSGGSAVMTTPLTRLPPMAVNSPSMPSPGQINSDEDLLGADLAPLGAGTLAVPPPLVAPMLSGGLGPGYIVPVAARRSPSAHSRASSRASYRGTSSRRQSASRSTRGKRRRSRSRSATSPSVSSRSSRGRSSDSSRSPSPRHHRRSRRSNRETSRPIREVVPPTPSPATPAPVAPAENPDAIPSSPAVGLSESMSFGGRGGNPMPRVPMVNPGSQLLPLLRSSVAPSTWNAHDSRPNVWILGHSHVYWAEQRAMIRPGGRSMGFYNADVRWRGIRGLRWLQALPELVDISRYAEAPSILVLHLGGNDLCFVHLGELIALIQSDLERFSSFFSRFILVWSEILPRAVWEGARDVAAIKRGRRLLNTRVSRFVTERGGVVVRHRELEGDNRGLLLPDGVHLSDIGLDIFLSDLQDGIDRALQLLLGGRSDM